MAPPAGFEPATHGLGIGLHGCRLVSSRPVWPSQLQFSSRWVTSRSAESFRLDGQLDGQRRPERRAPRRPVPSRRLHSRSRARRCRRGRIESHPGSLTPAVAASQEARRLHDRAMCIDAVPTLAMLREGTRHLRYSDACGLGFDDLMVASKWATNRRSRARPLDAARVVRGRVWSGSLCAIPMRVA